jgi:hypothetical protein
MMETVSTPETSVNVYETTLRNIPEDSHLHLNNYLVVSRWISAGDWVLRFAWSSSVPPVVLHANSPTVKMWIVSSPTCSYILTHVFTRGLLISLMIETVSTSETSTSFYQTTRRNIPEDSHIHVDCGLIYSDAV